jgi:membrane protein DedA with SNARE-associated domain
MELSELTALINQYDTWVYGILLAYCMGKTGPMAMLAGFAASMGALRLEAVLAATLLGSIAGGQLRFAVGRFAAPWLYRTFPNFAPWLALASAGVERYSTRVLLLYRFVKGTFSVVGLGAGGSLLTWQKFTTTDSLGALAWISCFVGLGWSLGKLGANLDPRLVAYIGLTFLVMSAITLSVLGKTIKARLMPVAERILQERTAAGKQTARP